jgi:hypothetical protein
LDEKRQPSHRPTVHHLIRASGLMALAVSIALSGCFGSSSRDDSDSPQDPATLRGPTFQVTAVTVAGKPRALVPQAPVLIGIKITPSKVILPFRIHSFQTTRPSVLSRDRGRMPG